MNHGTESSAGTGTTSYAPSAKQRANKPVKGPCAPPEREPPSTCCQLVCFERPNYFCGHLLTDDDLTKEQRYVIEKQKLYHRTLHGHGIVCGLRLTCDPQCCGRIWVGDGYAIDDCGNDLVVCDPQPVDVLAILREKGYILPPPAEDPCLPETPEEECSYKQCFYVTACYQEEGYEYTTPFVAGCRPTLSECEPTRIRERVTFDVVDSLPVIEGPLEAIERRVKKCFCLFTEGKFAALLKDQAVLDGLERNQVEHKTVFDAFCALRAALLIYLSCHPDHYNCMLEREIRDVTFPAQPQNQDPATNQQGNGPYLDGIHDAFCRIIELAYQHVIACILGELAVPCPAPNHASCVVLGTVEIQDGCVVRVCNCPRTYVWTFRSFFEVLVATIFGNLGCETTEKVPETDDTNSSYHDSSSHKRDCGCGKGPTQETCCHEFKLPNCIEFVRALRDNGPAATEVATAPFKTVRNVGRSLFDAFNLTRLDYFSPSSLFYQSAAEVAQKGFTVVPQPEVVPAVEPLDAFKASELKTVDEVKREFLFYSAGDRIVGATPRDVYQTQIDTQRATLEQQQKALDDLRKQVGELRLQIRKSEKGGGGQKPSGQNPG
jgi:hypothetical protein